MKARIASETTVVTEPQNRLAEFEALPKGTWGVIRTWGAKENGHYTGTIVQLHDNGLQLQSMECILTGLTGIERRYYYWSNWNTLKNLKGDFYIEPLTKGTEITIEL